MKTSQDPRHQKRVRVVQELFAWQFNQKEQLKIPISLQIIKSLSKIDKEIKKAAPSWPIEKINKVDLAILRLAVFELLIEQKEPFKVIVDEAVELAKEFGSDSSASFINGALGKLVERHQLEEEKNELS